MPDDLPAPGAERPAGTPLLYTRQDFVDAIQLHARMTPRRWILFLAFYAFVLAVAFYNIEKWDERAVFTIASALGGSVFYCFGRFVYNPWFAGRQFSRQPLAQIENVVALTPDGVSFASERGDMRLLWSDFIDWRADSRTIIMFRAPRLFMIVPTRLAAQGFPIDELKSALERHLGARK